MLSRKFWIHVARLDSVPAVAAGRDPDHGMAGPPKRAPGRSASGHGDDLPASAARASRPTRHLTAVAKSVGWPLECLRPGDYAAALEWIETVEATAERIPEAGRGRRATTENPARTERC